MSSPPPPSTVSPSLSSSWHIHSELVPIRDTQLCVHQWKPIQKEDDNNDSPFSPKVLIVLYHGFLAHGLYPTVRYAAEACLTHNTGDQSQDWAIVSADLRGHGRSCVPDESTESTTEKSSSSSESLSNLRGYLEYEHVVPDAVAIAQYAQSVLYPSAQKVFLMGTSMGATVALAAAQHWNTTENDNNNKLAGVILLAPMLQLSFSPLERWLLSGLTQIIPTWQIVPSGSATSSLQQYRDPHKRAECDQDPYACTAPAGTTRKFHVASMYTCVQLCHEVNQHLDQITCPLLILVADEDVVVDNAGAERLYEQAKQCTDKTKKHYPALHGLLCEPAPLVDEIGKDIVQWIKERL